MSSSQTRARRTGSLGARMVWTALLVLVALGGAGLAVSADRPHNPVQRPEMTWRADQQARPWLEALGDQLALISTDVSELSSAGRAVLGRLQALDVAAMDAAVRDGDALARRTATSVDELIALRTAAGAQLDVSRLGPRTTDIFGQIDVAIDSAQRVHADWETLAGDARRVGNLVETLLRHDDTVFRATTAGRQASWDDALALLDQADVALAAARATRDELALTASVTTLDDLLGRHAEYDSALRALYVHVRDTGEQSGETFDSLQAAVDEAQSALPADNEALPVIVGEAAGPSLTDSLVAIEEAHGDILEALDSIFSSEATPAP